ncbi:MAG: hypothetical protein HOE90_13075, partial [Bacteriovoracaceae bacterium]|nr:hypothetical protein [Bacteriovoracaceae bacterium]
MSRKKGPWPRKPFQPLLQFGKHFLVWFLTISLVQSGFDFKSFQAVADSYSDYSQKPFIYFNQDDGVLNYGEDTEIEFSLIGAESFTEIEWTIVEPYHPVGLELEGTYGSKAILFGSPMFQGKWCFVLQAKSTKNQGWDMQPLEKLTSGYVCLYSNVDEDDYDTPKIKSDYHISGARVGSHYTSEISLENDDYSELKLSFYDGNVPTGLELYQYNAGKSLELYGTPTEEGVFKFIVKASKDEELYDEYDEYDAYYTQEIFKQLQVNVDQRVSRGYLCPRGYYYDSTMGYCVQERGSICGKGTYYDWDSGRCRVWWLPSGIYCPAGTYYDHFLYRCVRAGSYRCPQNYKWDGYYNRCVRQPYTCNYGQKYNWYSKRCEWVGKTCSIGRHWSYSKNRCVSNHKYCSAGQYYSKSKGRCVRTSRYCGAGKYWDSHTRRCERARKHCSAGYKWNYSQNRCVRKTYKKTCSAGYHYSPGKNRCVPNYKPKKKKNISCKPGYKWSSHHGTCVKKHKPKHPGPKKPGPKKPGPKKPGPKKPGPKKPGPKKPGPKKPGPKKPGPKKPGPKKPGPKKPGPKKPGPKKPGPKKPGPKKPGP